MKNQKQFCKKLIFQDETGRTHILLGLILEQDDFFIKIKTRVREFMISKKFVVSVQDTNQEFEVDNDEYTYP
jgi:hypothetical protein